MANTALKALGITLLSAGGLIVAALGGAAIIALTAGVGYVAHMISLVS